jgi:glutamyl-tRNA reductase
MNHRVATVEVREKLAFHLDTLEPALQELRRTSGIPAEFALLSTCNRTEVYACASAAGQVGELSQFILAFLARQADLPPAVLEPLCYQLGSEQAARHLLRVAAGLDSLVVGENEILGQVRGAYQAAQSAEACGMALSALFRSAIQCGKRVRAETEIGQMGLSVSTVVVELAQELLGELNDRTALLIGAGKISAMTARALTQAGLRCILVANRTFERAQRLAHALGGQAVHFEQLPQSLVEADIVICSTGAPHIVLHTAVVQRAMEARPHRRLLVADLAMPRDADPAIASLAGVQLVQLDDLELQVQARHPLAAGVRQQAEEIVQEELECLQAWLEARRHAALISSLQKQASAIVQAQVQKTMRKLDGLSPEGQQAIERMGQAIASQLLYHPIRYLKTKESRLDLPEVEALLQELFGLEKGQ